MAVYRLDHDMFVELSVTQFGLQGIREREDIQRLLRDQIDIVCRNALVIAEEFHDWEDSKRRIDLLAIDEDANLVVVELKRNDDGAFMDLQAIRYAAMISTMTFDRAVEAFRDYRNRRNLPGDPRDIILEFLEWDQPQDNAFAQDVRIVLVAADFSKELTTAVLWLNERDLDIECVRLRPYLDEGRIIVDVQSIIPLPEAGDYRARLKAKQHSERERKAFNPDFTKFVLTLDGKVVERLAKRRLMLETVRFLTNRGHSPESIAETIHWRKNVAFFPIEGTLNSESFLASAPSAALLANRVFDARRYFCADDEIIHFGNRTYAFLNQWGARTPEAMDLLIKTFHDERISYRAMDPGEQ